jgi:hypothetical protein
MKYSNDTIGNRTRGFPACSAAQRLNQLLRRVLPSLTITAVVSVHIINRLVFVTDAECVYSKAVFLNRRAADRYRALASIIPGR